MAGLLALRSTERGHVWRLLRPTTASVGLKRKTGGNGAAPSVTSKPIKTVDDLPEIPFSTTLYRMIFKGYYNRMHELQLYERQRHGDMYKVKFGGITAVTLSNVELIEELFRKDDKFPYRSDLTTWTDYRDMRGYGYGISIEAGERWYKLRALLNKHMLHPKNYLKYEDEINEVVTDFLKRIDNLRKRSATGDLVPDISNELYRFAIEVVSNILFDARIGSLENEIPAETHDFINCISLVHTHTITLSMVPKWTRNYLPFWQKFVEGWDGIFKVACKLIDKKMDDIQKRLEKGQDAGGGYLHYFLSSPDMTRKDIYGSVAEFLVGGVDTTSNAMLWTLYLLSRDPKAQDTLYQEVSSIVKEDRIPTAEDINNMPYLKAVTKETLRMYPVISSNVRHVSDGDVIVGGHLFPKKTTFVMNIYATSHDETIFPDPWSFKPERWLRDGRKMPHAFGSIPFGVGVRGCAGQRIAKLEMHLALARIIKRFEVKPDPSVGEVKALNRIVLVADRPVNFHFLERK